MCDYVEVTKSAMGDAKIPNHKHYIVIGVEEFKKLSEDALFGRQQKQQRYAPNLDINAMVKSVKEKIDGDEITKAFVRGFDFRAASESKSEDARALTAELCYEVSCAAYNGAYGTVEFAPWNKCDDATRKMYQNLVDAFNRVFK